MIDIFRLPLYYISFNRNLDLEIHLAKYGFQNTKHFQAIDGTKLDPNELIKKSIITIRAYNDLLTGREEHSGISSLGAVGCTLSHYALWKKCVDDKLPYIIIAEDDAKFNRSVSDKDIHKISQILSESNGVYVSTNIVKKNVTSFWGLQFYILTNGACKELIKYTFPIDVQTDFYVAHLDTLGKINVEGFPLANQRQHISSTQDTCVKCYLPKNIVPYIITGILTIIVVILLIVVYKRWTGCKKDLQICRSPR